MNIEKFSQDFKDLLSNKNPLSKQRGHLFERVDLGETSEERKDNYVKLYNLYKDWGSLNLREPDEGLLMKFEDNSRRILNWNFETGEGYWSLLSHSLSSFKTKTILENPLLIIVDKELIKYYES